MKNKKYLSRNKYMLKGPLKRKGYDWWWHSFTGYHKVTGKPKSFFIEYFVMNPSKNLKSPVFGQTDGERLFDSGAAGTLKPSYVMIKAGAWGENAKQIHNFFSTDDLEIGAKQLSLRVGNCTLSEDSLIGVVNLSSSEAAAHPEYMSDSGSMSWNLKMDKQVAFNPGYATSWFFRSLNLFQMYWHAQGVKTEYSGTVIYDGEEYVVLPEKSYGYADKNWGSGFTKPWVWLSSCNLKSQITNARAHNSCFDIGGGCPKVLGIPLKRKLLVFLKTEDKTYEFNFSKFWKYSKVKFEFSESDELLHWYVCAENRRYLLDVDIYCPKSKMLFINYESPIGKKDFNKLWNGGHGYGNLKLFRKTKRTLEIVEDYIAENCGCEYGEE